MGRGEKQLGTSFCVARRLCKAPDRRSQLLVQLEGDDSEDAKSLLRKTKKLESQLDGKQQEGKGRGGGGELQRA